MTVPATELDLGSFDDELHLPADPVETDNEAAQPAIDIAKELSELGDEYRYGPRAYALAEAMTRGRTVAVNPKPEIKEMIETLTRMRWRLEDRELRLLATGDRAEPYAPTMREAAVLGAAANFLEIINANKAAVKRALQGAA